MGSVYEALAEVQHRVNCPKGQYNKFGGFAYRSLEDINAALKPVCEELGCSYWFSDEIVPMGLPAGVPGEDGGRWYLKATATFAAKGCDGTVSVTAYAREQLTKKGMDSAQITGLASSYARKYAACGLFAIDSGEDPDAMDNGKGSGKPHSAPKTPAKVKAAPATPETARPTAEAATEDQLVAVADRLGEFAELRGKSAREVMDALNATKTMKAAGVTPATRQYDSIQAARAVEVLDGWISKAKEN